MGAEEVPLALDERCGQSVGPQLIDVGQRGGEGRGGHAGQGRDGHDLAPGGQGLDQRGGEDRRGQQAGQMRVLVVSIAGIISAASAASAASAVVGASDVVQEAGADDATASPDPGHGTQVDVPAELRRGGGDLVEALGVGGDLGAVEGLFDGVDERFPVLAGQGGFGGAGSEVGGANSRARGGGGGDRPGEGGLGDGGDRDPELEGGLRGPHAGTLLPGGVDHDIHEGPAGDRIGAGEHLGGDVDEVGVELGVLP